MHTLSPEQVSTGSDAIQPASSEHDGAGTSSEQVDPARLSPKRLRVSETLVDAMETEQYMSFAVRYTKTTAEVRLAEDDTVSDLKAMLFSLTDVPPERQKILGLVRGKLPGDETVLGQLLFPPASLRDSPHPVTGEKRISITLVGTPIDQTFKDPQAPIDDRAQHATAHKARSDINYSDANAIRQIVNYPLTQDKTAIKRLRKVIERHSKTFHIMHAPRPNLKGGLLVLDLDYTIADTKRLLQYRVHAREAERPGLHEFLEAVYPYYDICVWSQTSLFWLEAKLTELGLLTSSKFNIAFVLDQTPMFSVFPEVKILPVGEGAISTVTGRGVAPGKVTEVQSHKVKALEIIWQRFSDHYSAANTIHIDDLARNFALNPGNGLKIKAFHLSARQAEACIGSGQPVASLDDDRELFALRKYLLQLAHPSVTDLRSDDGHANWKQCALPSVLDADKTQSESSKQTDDARKSDTQPPSQMDQSPD